MVRRGRTNTPLQALVLMNDPTYVEAARVMAQKLIQHGGEDGALLDRAFAMALAREPQDAEREILLRFLGEERARFAEDLREAEKFITVGESMRDPSLFVAEHAAWTAVCSLILNLDETLTRN